MTTGQNYFWELGIEWNAATGAANASYLPAGFVQPHSPSGPVIKRPHVYFNDTITFRIFDLTKSQVASIESFTINPQAAVALQTSIDPLNTLQPVRTSTPPRTMIPSTYFGDSFPCWEYQVTVTEAEPSETRFLLNFFVQAQGTTDPVGPRTFVHDPEMVVGPNM